MNRRAAPRATWVVPFIISSVGGDESSGVNVRYRVTYHFLRGRGDESSGRRTIHTADAYITSSVGGDESYVERTGKGMVQISLPPWAGMNPS